jgi:hypothetical protein
VVTATITGHGAITPSVLAAANRIMHMDYDRALTLEQRMVRVSDDANIVAGAIALLAAGEKP